MKSQSCILLVIFLMPAMVQAKTARLFIFDGQSNCRGTGNGDALTPPYSEVSDELLLFYTQWKHAWVSMQPYPYKNERFGIENTAFGPELSFAHAMKKQFPDDIIAVAKHAEGGASIIAWDAHWERPEWKQAMQDAGNGHKTAQYKDLIRLIDPKAVKTPTAMRFARLRVSNCFLKLRMKA